MMLDELDFTNLGSSEAAEVKELVRKLIAVARAARRIMPVCCDTSNDSAEFNIAWGKLVVALDALEAP